MNLKIIKLFLATLMIVGMATTSWALPILVGEYSGFNDDYVTAPKFQDNHDNVNAVLKRYNEINPPLPAPISLLRNVEAGNYGSSITNPTYKDGEIKEDEIIAGTLLVAPGAEYLSLKWDADKGGFALWYVAGVASLDFGTLSHGLSHYREWSAVPTPEPATLLLFGTGIVGLAGLTRKRLIKK